MNTGLLFKRFLLTNQCLRGYTTDWCYKSALTYEEKTRRLIPVDNRILAMVEAKEVDK